MFTTILIIISCILVSLIVGFYAGAFLASAKMLKDYEVADNLELRAVNEKLLEICNTYNNQVSDLVKVTWDEVYILHDLFNKISENERIQDS